MRIKNALLAVAVTASMLTWTPTGFKHEAPATGTCAAQFLPERIAGVKSDLGFIGVPVGLFTGGSKSLIKTVQQVPVTIALSATSGTGTIPTAVTTANCMCLYAGYTTGHTSSTGERALEPAFKLTNSTTITATNNTADASNTHILEVTVIEFNSFAVASNQSGTITFATGDTSKTATITSVNVNNSVAIWQGQNINNSAGTLQVTYDITLTSATVVTASTATTGVTGFINFTVFEFASGILNSAVQQGSITNSATTATISSVTIANCLLLYQGATYNTTWTSYPLYGYLTMTNGTTVTLTQTAASVGFKTRFAVIEFASKYIKSMDQGSLACTTSSTTGTHTITVTNLNKVVANWTGYTGISASANPSVNNTALTLDIANSRLIVTRAVSNASVPTTGYQALEFV